ncbi:hybrid sensor histidine kinase/response regulator [Arenicella xantha]|uniref:histidine kinase n=1 Tax=Arenicella xantha TaxID=644221 RepID=A0A395JKA8_9GAMM|nr:hybrid sensor histidine kinase/response regulator [Arenicella xantha]RBP51121.1 signal transduction histidine kinase [Arenicella xantha]
MTLTEFQLYEQTNALYKQLPAVIMGTAGVYVLTLGMLWSTSDRTYLLIWVVAAYSILLLRWLSVLKFHSAAHDPSSTQYWFDQVVIWATLTGIVWGLVPLLFIKADEPVLTLMITCAFAGYMAASVSSMALSFRVFLSFSVPMSVLFFLGCLLRGGSLLYAIAGMIFLFLFILVSFAKNAHSVFQERSTLSYENKSLVDQLTEQKEAAENAVFAKDRFLAAASHDLRQPLHASGMFVDALNHLNLGKDAEAILEKLTLSTSSLNKLLHELLDISRLDANVVEYLPKGFNLSKLLERIYQEYRDGHAGSNIELVLSVEPSLFSYSDPMLLERVIRNLVENALKFTDHGSVTLSAARNDDETIDVKVVDTGIGIPDAEHSVIFLEFTQLNNPERDRQKGLGLGLTIVKRLCSLMSIPLSLESSPNVGTTLTLRLTSSDPVDTIETTDMLSLSLVDRVILVIDDELDIRDGMTRILEQSGAQVVAAADCLDAIRGLHDKDLIPELIVADFRLRGDINGIDAIKQIRDEFNIEIKAMLITGDTSPDRLLLAQAGKLRIEHKPIAAAKLLDIIASELVK